MRNQVLLAIDDTEASEKAARYVGELLAPTNAVVRVLTVLPLAPRTFSTTGDSSRAATAVMAESRTDPAKTAWLTERAKDAHPALERIREVLLDAGVGEGRVKLDYYAPKPEESVARALLTVAEQFDCDTIVVGHHSLPWHRNFFDKHIGERLARHARNRAVWVVD